MSRSDPTVIAVIPAFNEARTIGAIVRELRRVVSSIIVVDDASRDQTSEEARTAGAIILRHSFNCGYDASLDDGFAEAARRGADIILSIDADGEHNVDDVPTLLAPILSGTADIVVGERSDIRYFAERLFALYTSSRFGIRDPLCGMKAYRRSVYDAVGHFDSVRSIGTELMLKGHAKGFRLDCVDVVLRRRIAGDASRFYTGVIAGNLRIIRALFRVLFI